MQTTKMNGTHTKNPGFSTNGFKNSVEASKILGVSLDKLPQKPKSAQNAPQKALEPKKASSVKKKAKKAHKRTSKAVGPKTVDINVVRTKIQGLMVLDQKIVKLKDELAQAEKDYMEAYNAFVSPPKDVPKPSPAFAKLISVVRALGRVNGKDIQEKLKISKAYAHIMLSHATKQGWIKRLSLNVYSI